MGEGCYRTAMDAPPAVYAKHPAIDAGSELRLDQVVGVRRFELDHAFQRLGESEDDLRNLYLDERRLGGRTARKPRSRLAGRARPGHG